MNSMTSLVVSAARCFTIIGCGLSATRQAVDVVTRTVDSLNGGMTHCRDVSTKTDQLSFCLALRLFGDRRSL